MSGAQPRRARRRSAGRGGRPVLHARLLGGLRLEEAGGSVLSVPTGRARSLLAFLLLDPSSRQSRERLSETLWPEQPPEQATRFLIDALYRLRQALPGGTIAADRTTVGFGEDVDLSTDVEAFEALAGSGEADRLAAAVRLYGGELLPEVYEDWIVPRRAALADSYRSALAELAQRAESAGALADAFQYYHWLTAADPLDEAGHRGLMRAYLRSGHPAAAIQQYERLAALLRAELGIEPSEASEAVVTAARRATEAAEPPAARPFVGRRRERAAILEHIESPPLATPRVVLVEGEPGIGKSRLLEVLADDARWRGFEVAAGRAASGATSTPYAPLDSALGGVLSASALDRLRRSLSPATIDAVVGLLPDLVDLQQIAGGRPEGERPNVAVGLASLFRELTRHKPWLLLLDDVHLAGPAFWEALGFLAIADDVRLAVVLAARPAELRSQPVAWEALRAIDRELAPRRITLSGLSIDDTRALAAAIGRPLADPELADIHRISEGNPLYLQQAVAASGRPGGRPGFVELLEHRLALLEPAARHALEAAAVLGPSFSLAEWTAVSAGLPPEAIDAVVAARFVIELSDRYALEHDLTREHVYEGIEPVRRRALHGLAARALPPESAQPAVLAWHHERAGEHRAAIDHHRRAAELAFARYAYPEAVEHAERALALDPPPGERLRLLTLRHRILGLQLRLDAWRATLDEAEDLAVERGDRLALIDVLEGRVTLHTLEGDVAAMEDAGRRALELAVELRDAAAEGRVLTTLAWHVSESLGDNPRAVPMLRRAVRLAAEIGDEPGRVNALCVLSSALRSAGRCRAAHVSASRAMTLVATRPRLYRGRARALAELAETALELARWQEAREAMTAALDAYRELDDPWSYGSALFGVVNIGSGMGLGNEAVGAGRELVDLSRKLGLAPTSDYGIWHRVGLGRAMLAAADLDGASRVIDEVGEVIPGAARPAIALAGLRGQLALFRDDPGAALEAIWPGFEAWRARSEPRDAVIALWTAVAAARAGRDDLARRSLDAGEASLANTDTERHDVLRHLARYEVGGAAPSIRAARLALDRQAARITDPALRAAFERDAPVHRMLARHAEAQPETPATMRLVRADVPLGRAIRDDEWVEIRLPSVDDHPPAGLDASTARRERILRILEEAREAGATATDDQLAAALGVSRRTIIRDIAALRDERRSVVTRRRRG